MPEMTASEGYYETYWSENGFLPHGSLWPELAEYLALHLPASGTVVDVGCGDGRTSGVWLSARGYDYVGVDVSSNAVELALGAGLRAQHINDAGELPFDDGSVDAVVIIEVLEHLFAPQKAVAEARRILKPGGVLIVTAPNIAYWRSRANLALVGRFDPLGDDASVSQPWRDPHIRFFAPRTMAQMLLGAGFADVEVTGQRGGIVNGLPWINRRMARAPKSSAAYRRLERRWPNLFAYNIAGRAIK